MCVIRKVLSGLLGAHAWIEWYGQQQFGHDYICGK